MELPLYFTTELNNSVIFSQAGGIKIQSNASETAKKFKAAGGFLGQSNAAITQLFDTPKKVWLCVDGKVAFYDKQEKKIHKQPFRTIDLGIIGGSFSSICQNRRSTKPIYWLHVS